MEIIESRLVYYCRRKWCRCCAELISRPDGQCRGLKRERNGSPHSSLALQPTFLALYISVRHFRLGVLFFRCVASKVADEIWQAVSEGQDEVVIADLKTKVAVLLRALAPRVLFRIMAKRALKAKEGAQ